MHRLIDINSESFNKSPWFKGRRAYAMEKSLWMFCRFKWTFVSGNFRHFLEF